MGLILFVQAPDIYKEEARRKLLTHTHSHTHTLTHTQNRTPERNDQKGAAQHPEINSWAYRRREKQLEGKGDTTVCWVRIRARCVSRSCRAVQHHRHLRWTTTRVFGGGAGDRAPPVLEKAEPGRRCAALDIFVCQVELGLFFSSVLCWAGLRYQSRVVVVLASAGLCCGGCCCCCCCCWFTVDLGWSLSGRHELSTFPLPSGATPRPWRCRCPWGVLISSASTGALYAGFFRSGHMEMREHSAHTLTVLHCRFTLQ